MIINQNLQMFHCQKIQKHQTKFIQSLTVHRERAYMDTLFVCFGFIFSKEMDFHQFGIFYRLCYAIEKHIPNFFLMCELAFAPYEHNFD